MKSRKMLWTAGYKLNTYKGLFAKLQGKGVSFDMGRQICFEGHRLDHGSKGGGSSAALLPAQLTPWPAARNSMANLV